jgi:HPt (histidine-containing phosphotransfer) domain-containing protein
MSFEQITINEDEKTLPFRLVPAGNPNHAVDMDVLNSFEELQSDDGSDLIVELIDLYLEDAPLRIRAIREAAVRSEWVQLQRAAHNLKGSSSNLGVRHVAEMSAKLEVAAHADSSDGVDALVQLLEYKFAKAHEALATERRKRTA